jgi:mannose-1-phosphate guanylyltransferase
MQGVFGTQLRGMVLAAGMGSRLKGLGIELPKPLLPVCNHPLITYALAPLRGHGITEVGINLHHLGENITELLGSGADYGVDIFYSQENELLGTGGGVRRIADYLTHGGREPCVIVNGKILIEVDLEVVLAMHRITGAAATMVLVETPDADKWGAIEVDGDGRVYRLLGEASPASAPQKLHKCMFTGVHIVEPSLLERLPRNGPSCIVRQGYLPALRDGEIVSAYVIPGYFFEHSTPARYLQGNVNALRGVARLSHLPGPLVGVSARAQVSGRALLRPPVCIGAGAVIEDNAVVGPDVVLGEGAHVERGVQIERAVVFSGVHVKSSMRDAIATKQAIHPATAT